MHLTNMHLCEGVCAGGNCVLFMRIRLLLHTLLWFPSCRENVVCSLYSKDLENGSITYTLLMHVCVLACMLTHIHTHTHTHTHMYMYMYALARSVGH